MMLEQNPSVTILVGDARERLSDLPDGSVHCVITSPPYWGQRRYEDDPGMIGMEDTWEEHLEALMDVFAEVRRVLRDDGTMWVNYGDSYWGGKGASAQAWSGSHRDRDTLMKDHHHVAGKGETRPTDAKHALWKPKDLMLLPARLGIAFQERGWWLRQEVVWSKPNPKPESVDDRPTCAHEKLLLLSKSPRYFYDHHAVRTPQKESSVQRAMNARNTEYNPTPHLPTESLNRPRPRRAKVRGHVRPEQGLGELDQMTKQEQQAKGANLRNVWQIATKPFKETHFATFPPELVELPIKAGTSEHGVCSVCGAPHTRIVETDYLNPGGRTTNGPRSVENRHESAGFEQRLVRSSVTAGWEAGCDCDADRVPAAILDPFGGAGTVGLVAQELGRSSVLIEVSPKYAAMSERRIKGAAPMFADITVDHDAA